MSARKQPKQNESEPKMETNTEIAKQVFEALGQKAMLMQQAARHAERRRRYSDYLAKYRGYSCIDKDDDVNLFCMKEVRGDTCIIHCEDTGEDRLLDIDRVTLCDPDTVFSSTKGG